MTMVQKYCVHITMVQKYCVHITMVQKYCVHITMVQKYCVHITMRHRHLKFSYKNVTQILGLKVTMRQKLMTMIVAN
jgi:hypothetical protein